jgi:hypothetical protein
MAQVLSVGVISGVIFFHLTKFEIALSEVDDHSEFFTLAVIGLSVVGGSCIAPGGNPRCALVAHRVQ